MPSGDAGLVRPTGGRPEVRKHTCADEEDLRTPSSSVKPRETSQILCETRSFRPSWPRLEGASPAEPPGSALSKCWVRFVSSAVDAPSGLAFLGSWEGPSRRCRETRHEPTLRRLPSDEAAHTSRRAAPKGPRWRRIGRGSGCWRCCGRAGSPGSTGMDLVARTGCESASTRRFRTNLAERNQKKRITGGR